MVSPRQLEATGACPVGTRMMTEIPIGPFVGAQESGGELGLPARSNQKSPLLFLLRAGYPLRRALVTCLISSGHFNLEERPQLLQLNNAAA